MRTRKALLKAKLAEHNLFFAKTPGVPPQEGGANGSSAVIAGAFGQGFPRPHNTRVEALEARAQPARKAGQD